VATQRLDEQERRFQSVNERLAQVGGEDEQLKEQYQQALARSEAAEHAQVQLVSALRSLTNRQDASPALARALTDADLADPLSKAAQKLDLAQAAGPEQVALAGQAYVSALRDRVQTMAEKLEEAHGQLTGTKDSEGRMQGELAAIRAAVVDRDHQLENLNAAMEKTKEDHASLLSQMMDQQRAHDANLAALKQVQEQLRLAQAELEDYHARDAAASGHFTSDTEALRKEMEKERELREVMEHQLSELRQQIEANEARLKSQREEFTHRLEERDQVIHQKDRQLDHLTAQRTDTKSLEAQVQAISRELANANDRIKELEGAYGENAGVAVRSGDLTRELKNLQAERDQLREQHRQLDADLADAVSLNAQLKTQLEEKRKDQAGLREKMTKELGEERDKSSAMRDEFRKLKEEVVGLRARIRRLTDSGGGSSGTAKAKG
jgi:chromosome segregation ATPase